MTGGSLVLMEGVGHGPRAAYPVKVNLLIREFIKSVRACFGRVRARYPDQEDFFERDGVRVAYELYEAHEPTLLFVPQPAITHARSLKGVVPYLSRHFRVLVVDGRGNGRSDRPRDPDAYAAEAFVADCVAAMDATETERAIAISFSSRAVVGLRLCVEHADRVRAAIFATPDAWPTDFYVRPLSLAPQEKYADGDVFNFHYMRADWRAFAERWARVLYPHKHSTKQREDAVAYATATDADAFIASILGRGLLSRDEALALAARIDVPTLVLQNGGGSVGNKESSGPLADAMGAKLHVFEGKGPLVVSRWPVLFNLAVREFAESQRACAAAPVATRAAERLRVARVERVQHDLHYHGVEGLGDVLGEVGRADVLEHVVGGVRGVEDAARVRDDELVVTRSGSSYRRRPARPPRHLFSFFTMSELARNCGQEAQKLENCSITPCERPNWARISLRLETP